MPTFRVICPSRRTGGASLRCTPSAAMAAPSPGRFLLPSGRTGQARVPSRCGTGCTPPLCPRGGSRPGRRSSCLPRGKPISRKPRTAGRCAPACARADKRRVPPDMGRLAGRSRNRQASRCAGGRQPVESRRIPIATAWPPTAKRPFSFGMTTSLPSPWTTWRAPSPAADVNSICATAIFHIFCQLGFGSL